MKILAQIAACSMLILFAIAPGSHAQTECKTAVWQSGEAPLIVFSGSEGIYLYPTSSGDQATRHLACVGMDCAGHAMRPDLKTVTWFYSLTPVGDGSGEQKWLKEVVLQPKGRFWPKDTVRVHKYLVRCDR
jgi:hypothetical protein